MKIEISMWSVLEFENLKIEMFEFGCVNTESWKLKIDHMKYIRSKTCNPLTCPGWAEL